MKMSERIRRNMRTDKPMTLISLRLPEDVIEDLKEVAPSLGFGGYQALIRAYISNGLRKHLAEREADQAKDATVDEFSRRLLAHGVSENTVQKAAAEMRNVQDPARQFVEPLVPLLLDHVREGGAQQVVFQMTQKGLEERGQKGFEALIEQGVNLRNSVGRDRVGVTLKIEGQEQELRIVLREEGTEAEASERTPELKHILERFLE